MTPPLEWLHDCHVTTVTYEVTDAGRTLTVAMTAPADLGHPQWDGQRLIVRCDDVTLFQWTAWGHAIGPELLDAWDTMPIDQATDLAPFLKTGGRRPA